MKMRICDVIEKIKGIDEAIINTTDDDVESLLEEYRDKILMTPVDI